MSKFISAAFPAGNLLGLFKNPIKNIPLHSLKSNINLRLCSNSSEISSKKTYNTPHPPKDPPENYNPLCVEHEAFDVPEFIPAAVFRQFSSSCETLGPGADKRGCYKNPEYYSYHRYSFAALQLACLKIREQRKESANIRCLYDDEHSEGEEYSSDEDKKCS